MNGVTTKYVIERLGADDLRDTLATNPNHAWKKRNINALEGMVWHQALGWSSFEDIAKYHTGPKSHLRDGGVHSISYSMGVRRSGEICVFNDFDEATWSHGYKERPGDENSEFVAVLFEGMFRWDDTIDKYAGQLVGEPTQEQLQSALFIWETCSKIWNWGIKDLYGHFDFGKPACPGTTLQNLILSIRSQYNFSKQEDIARFLTEYKFNGIADFQRQAHLKDDGIWGKVTSEAAYRFVQTHKLDR